MNINKQNFTCYRCCSAAVQLFVAHKEHNKASLPLFSVKAANMLHLKVCRAMVDTHTSRLQLVKCPGQSSCQEKQ